MIFLRDLSIRYKLILLILFISGVVLLLATTAFIINDLIVLQTTMERTLKVQTKITAANTVSPLQFGEDYQDEAKKTLKALEKDDYIVLAQIYKFNEQQPFATYLRQGTPMPQLLGDFREYELLSSHQFLQFSQPMLLPNSQEIIGSTVLLLDWQPLYDHIQSYVSIAITISLVSVLIALFLSTWLQSLVTSPILSLAALMRRVSNEKNYSLRVQIQGKDELGTLAKGFNAMLQAVQERDDQLEQHREQLERTVANRTAELKKLNLKLTYQAYHDALTNLPNRALFIRRVEQAIEYAEQSGELLAILFIDLDRFKYINDTLGHAAGDSLLQEVAKRLLACTRQPEDTVARLGGDEFTLLLRDVKEPLNAGIVAKHIINSLTKPLYFFQQELYLTPSIGISIYPKDGKEVGSLMKNADAGMYMAKQQGRNGYRFYTSSDNAASAIRLNMENKLRHALEYGEFEVWYQPRLDIRSNRIVGAEALARWRSPELDFVPPAQFIPLAEDTGLIIPIGEWILRTACQESLRWQIPGQPPLQVSVNLSARQFLQEELLTHIERLLKELQMNPYCLELELTESLIMPNAGDTIGTLRALKKLGIQLSIDDFGTGYSSLSYLKRFPIDTLKIDQSFVRDIRIDTDDSALVTAIIAMAHNLKLTVVAEGVETQEQLDFLISYHCDYIQGYLFGRPMPAPEFRKLLTRSETSH